jgi:hypothetical protein
MKEPHQIAGGGVFKVVPPRGPANGGGEGAPLNLSEAQNATAAEPQWRFMPGFLPLASED